MHIAQSTWRCIQNKTFSNHIPNSYSINLRFSSRDILENKIPYILFYKVVKRFLPTFTNSLRFVFLIDSALSETTLSRAECSLFLLYCFVPAMSRNRILFCTRNASVTIIVRYLHASISIIARQLLLGIPAMPRYRILFRTCPVSISNIVSYLPCLDIEYCSVWHGVEEGPEGGVAAAVVELVEQLHVGNEDRHRLVGLQPYSISFLSFQLVSTFQEIN